MPTKTNRIRVTLKTVAEKAGVSVATVSLILSGRDEWLNQFRADTVAKVQQCAKQLGYRANVFATGLPTQKSPFFSLVLAGVGEKDLGTWHHWAFEGSLLAGVVRAATKKHLYPVVATSPQETDETGISQIAKISNGGVFGSIVRSPTATLEKFLRRRIREGHPVVVVFPNRLDAWPNNAIDVDNYEIGQIAGRILLAHDRRNWMIARYQKASMAQRLRAQGVLDLAREAGRPVHCVQLPGDVNEFSIRGYVGPALARLGSDGLFAVDAVTSVGSVMACMAGGRKPGTDVDIVGCDCSLRKGGDLPTITSLDISWREVGVLALNKLVELTENSTSIFETMLLNPRATPGGTCSLPPELAASPNEGDGRPVSASPRRGAPLDTTDVV